MAPFSPEGTNPFAQNPEAADASPEARPADAQGKFKAHIAKTEQALHEEQRHIASVLSSVRKASENLGNSASLANQQELIQRLSEEGVTAMPMVLDELSSALARGNIAYATFLWSAIETIALEHPEMCHAVIDTVLNMHDAPSRSFIAQRLVAPGPLLQSAENAFIAAGLYSVRFLLEEFFALGGDRDASATCGDIADCLSHIVAHIPGAAERIAIAALDGSQASQTLLFEGLQRSIPPCTDALINVVTGSTLESLLPTLPAAMEQEISRRPQAERAKLSQQMRVLLSRLLRMASAGDADVGLARIIGAIATAHGYAPEHDASGGRDLSQLVEYHNKIDREQGGFNAERALILLLQKTDGARTIAAIEALMGTLPDPREQAAWRATQQLTMLAIRNPSILPSLTATLNRPRSPAVLGHLTYAFALSTPQGMTDLAVYLRREGTSEHWIAVLDSLSGASDGLEFTRSVDDTGSRERAVALANAHFAFVTMALTHPVAAVRRAAQTCLTEMLDEFVPERAGNAPSSDPTFSLAQLNPATREQLRKLFRTQLQNRGAREAVNPEQSGAVNILGSLGDVSDAMRIVGIAGNKLRPDAERLQAAESLFPLVGTLVMHENGSGLLALHSTLIELAGRASGGARRSIVMLIARYAMVIARARIPQTLSPEEQERVFTRKRSIISVFLGTVLSADIPMGGNAAQENWNTQLLATLPNTFDDELLTAVRRSAPGSPPYTRALTRALQTMRSPSFSFNGEHLPLLYTALTRITTLQTGTPDHALLQSNANDTILSLARRGALSPTTLEMYIASPSQAPNQQALRRLFRTSLEVLCQAAPMPTSVLQSFKTTLEQHRQTWVAAGAEKEHAEMLALVTRTLTQAAP